MDRTGLNARIGRLLYRAVSDEAGYPNGLPLWEELSPEEKFRHAMTALGFLDYLVQEGFVTRASRDFGLRGEAIREDRDALRKHFLENADRESAKMAERIRGIRMAIGGGEAFQGGSSP